MSEPVPVAAASAAGGRRIKVLGAGAVGLLAVGLLLPRLLFGAESPPVDDFPVPTPTGATATTVPGSATPVRPVVFSGKNPFDPVVLRTASSAGSGAPSTTGSAVPVVDVSQRLAAPIDLSLLMPVLEPSPPIVSFPAPPAAAPIAPPPAPAPAPVAPPVAVPTARFALVEVVTEPTGQVGVRVRIDTALTGAVVGQDFASSYRLVSADPAKRCASFLFGDRAFSLCVGEETRT